MRDQVILQAPAKINLYLKVTGRREDGYHFLATLMQKVSLYDSIELQRICSGIQLHCPDSDLPEDDTNLAFRAAKLFLEGLKGRLPGRESGVSITLRKAIPVGAGLGGGSSDAAAVLRGLDRLFATGCSEEDLHGMGLALGADVPFFISDFPVAWATGIGEQLQAAVPLAGYLILLVNPGYSVSTRWVYENFALTVVQNINNLKNFGNSQGGYAGGHPFADRSIRCDELVNDLEQVTSAFYRDVALLKGRILRCGADAAMMTGSGPTVFGLFRASEAERAAACEQELKGEYKVACLVNPLET